LVDNLGVRKDYVWGKHEAPPEPVPQEEVVAALEEEAAEDVDTEQVEDVDDGAADEPEAITEEAPVAS
jgi:hypothetical protein